MSAEEKRFLAPYLVDFHTVVEDGRNVFLELVADSKDPVLLAYGNIIQFHILLEKYRGGGTPEYKKLSDSCRLPAHGCSLVTLLEKADVLLGKKTILESEISEFIRLSRPFLATEALRPPFYRLIAERLPDKLGALSLPLEAAILAERMTFRDSSAAAKRIRSMIPAYLSGAADFRSTLRYMGRRITGARPAELRMYLDMLILSERYREAVEFISGRGPGSFFEERSAYESPDYWSGFSFTPDQLRLQLATLIYLAGDAKKGARALEDFGEASGATGNGEPLRYFARLRLAQMLLGENPELAHKIAEDITYLAQAKGWEVLEYRATILDGWAMIQLKKYYPAIISFTKARGILTGKNRAFSSEYSRLLGLLAARNRMTPGRSQKSLVRTLYGILQKSPPNRSLFVLRQWLPVFANLDYFAREALDGLDSFEALSFLVEFERYRKEIFPPGFNPGGLSGFATSLSWMRELERLPYRQVLYPSLRRTGSGVANFVEGRRGSLRTDVLSAKKLNIRDYYLFSFPFAGSRLVYFLHPVRKTIRVRTKRRKWVKRRVRTLEVVKLTLEAGKEARLLANCAHPEASGCSQFHRDFGKVRKELQGSAGRTLRIQHTPRFDIDYETLLLSGLKRKPAVEYFHSPYTRKSSVSFPERKRLLRLTGCPAPDFLPNEARFLSRFSDFFEEGGSGIWIWPQSVDELRSNSGKLRPVYLRHFQCNNERLRFWDLDRFAGNSVPALMVYAHGKGDSDLRAAFGAHFAKRGTVLLEHWSVDRARDNYFLSLLKKSRKKSPESVLREAFGKLQERYTGVRIIFPHL